MRFPVVSVCLPAHNVVQYLADTIQSVRSQTFQDWELVIANGATTDDTERVLQEILCRQPDGRIRIFRNPGTFTMAENWNSALSLARGEFLKLLCADDLMTSDCLARQVGALQSHPAASLASGTRVIINRHGRPLFHRNGIGLSGVNSGKDIIRRCVYAGTNLIGDPVNVMWRRSAMEKAGLFDPGIVYCTDLDFWLRLLAGGDLYFDRDPVGYYRIHPSAATSRLGRVIVEDFLHTVRKQIASGILEVSPHDMRGIRWRAWLKNAIRQILYRVLG